MAMKYQKGTVYPRGRKVKMWYGKYTVYLRNERRKGGSGSGATFRSAPKPDTPKWKAEQMLHALILNETGVPAKTADATADDSATFRWFVEERYIPMRQGAWSPAYRKINTYEIKHYLVDHFGRVPLAQAGHVRDPGLAEQSGNEILAVGCSPLLFQHSLNHAHGQEA